MPFFRYRSAAAFILAVLVASGFGQAMQVGESNLTVSGDMQLKWIGKGLDRVFDFEIVLTQAMLADSSRPMGSDYDGRFRLKTTTALVSLHLHPRDIIDVKLSMPYLYKQGPDGKTGPFGDLSLDINRSWGTINRVNAGLTLGFPTGFSSIMRDNTTFISVENQLGSGVFGASVRASYSFNPEWGIINAGASYTAGLLAIRTTEYGYDTNTTNILYDKKALEIARDGWGARNDAGVVRPDFLGVFTDFGIKTETVNHGISIGYFYPAAPFKYDTYSKGTTTSPFSSRQAAQTFLDTGNTAGNETYFVAGQIPADSTWVYVKKTTQSKSAFPSLTLQYNIEKNDLAFPIFLGGLVKLDYHNRLNFAGFALGLGFKFSVY